MKANNMYSTRPSSGISRRFLLSALAVLSSSLRSLAYLRASAGRRPAPVLEQGSREAVDLGLRRRCDARGFGGFRACPQRVATFDNDGTLWVEQPMYRAARLCARSRQGARARAS